MLRLCPLFLLTACGVFGLSEDKRQALAHHQSFAQLYWEGGKLDQAVDQVRRGLEIEPNDYKLHTIRAWCLLRQGQASDKLLPAAAAQFDRVMELRSANEQAPQARLGYSIVHSKLGFLKLQQADTQLEEAKTRGLSGESLAARETAAKTLRQEAETHFAQAEDMLQSLIDSGDQLLEANYHLMQVRTWRGDHPGAIAAGDAYLARVIKLQAAKREELARTLSADYERQVRLDLQSRIAEELDVRAFLANLYYKNGRHDLVIDQLDEVLRQDPERYHEYLNRGRSLLALQRVADANRDLEKFLASTKLPREHPQVRTALDLLKHNL